MSLNLESLGKLLKAEIYKIGDIRFIQLNDDYILTENPMNKEVELNDLQNYTSVSLSSDKITDILDFKSTQLLKDQHQ